MKEEISCVCLRRNLLCFGTISGAVLLFRQIDQDSCDPYAGKLKILRIGGPPGQGEGGMGLWDGTQSFITRISYLLAKKSWVLFISIYIFNGVTLFTIIANYRQLSYKRSLSPIYWVLDIIKRYRPCNYWSTCIIIFTKYYLFLKILRIPTSCIQENKLQMTELWILILLLQVKLINTILNTSGLRP